MTPIDRFNPSELLSNTPKEEIKIGDITLKFIPNGLSFLLSASAFVLIDKKLPTLGDYLQATLLIGIIISFLFSIPCLIYEGIISQRKVKPFLEDLCQKSYLRISSL